MITNIDRLKYSNKSDSYTNLLLLAIFAFFLIIYFLFHLIKSDGGILALVKRNNTLSQMRSEEIFLAERVEELKYNINRITSETDIDQDFLDEQIRKQFSYVKDNEVMIVLPEENITENLKE